jgi:hypothetical protein
MNILSSAEMEAHRRPLESYVALACVGERVVPLFDFALTNVIGMRSAVVTFELQHGEKTGASSPNQLS